MTKEIFIRSFYLVIAVAVALVTTSSIVHSKGFGGEVSFKITIDATEDNTDTRLWLPYPVSDEYQDISDIHIEGNQNFKGIFRDPSTGNLALYAEWTKPRKDRRLDFSFTVTSTADREVNVTSAVGMDATSMPAEMSVFLEGTDFIPVDGVVKEISDKIVTEDDTIAERARAVYDWVVDNTYRDPEIHGCGTGDVEVLLTKKAGGGKCADISSVFVAIARASGVPAREVFGLRLGGPSVSDITKDHHCWAEFYQPGTGWVPVDPADVRKAALVNNMKIEDAGSYREHYFGAVDGNRVVLGRGGRGVSLVPKLRDGPLNYFMYPYAEVDGKALPWLAAQKGLKYSVTFKE